jgi:hypothetical protein
MDEVQMSPFWQKTFARRTACSDEICMALQNFELAIIAMVNPKFTL